MRTFTFFALLVFFLPSSVDSAGPGIGNVQLEGQIVPVVSLEISAPGVNLKNDQVQTGTLNFGNVNAGIRVNNPIGRQTINARMNEAYFQTDLFVRVRLAGTLSHAQLVVSEGAPGPLHNLIYEADESTNLSDLTGLDPIPLDPQKKVAVAYIPPGNHEFRRQLILRVPAALEAGPKQAMIFYNLAVSP
ncbi:MAG: hypothetical protein U1F57_11350 [bacterium]